MPRFLYNMLLHWEKSTIIVGRKLQSIWTLDCSASYKVLLPETLPAAALEVPTIAGVPQHSLLCDHPPEVRHWPMYTSCISEMSAHCNCNSNSASAQGICHTETPQTCACIDVIQKVTLRGADVAKYNRRLTQRYLLVAQ